jgi:hypothetical protein
MAKSDGSDTVTMTRDELRKLITEEVTAATALVAKGAADATVGIHRGLAGIQGQLATLEERTSVELGKVIPLRKPFKMLVQHCEHPRLGVKFDAHIKVREHDSEGRALESPVLTVERIEITEWPSDLVERCKLPSTAKESGPGAGGKRVVFQIAGDKIDRYWTNLFLQWTYDTFTKPLSAELGSGADPVYLKPYAVGEMSVRDLGEIRRSA